MAWETHQMTPRQQFWLLTGVAVAMTVVFGIIGFQVLAQQADHAKKRAAFAPYLGEFLSMPSPPEGNVHRGVPRGKLVLIDLKKWELDEMHFFTPNAADSPEDVETVVWLKWDAEAVDSYQGGGDACRWLCTGTVFDRQDQRLIAQKDFRGGDPPLVTTTPSGSNDYGSKPEYEIRTWLKELRGQ